MMIKFIGESNCKSVWINTVTFKMADGTIAVVDRDTTYCDFLEFSMQSKDHYCCVMDMDWFGCYIWNGENCNYNIEAMDFEDAEIVSIDIEDEAPENYEVKINAWRAYD